MTRERKIVLDHASDVSIIACSACAFVRGYSRKGKQRTDAELKEEFEQHVCIEHPRPKKNR